jgi:hypothetical protein
VATLIPINPAKTEVMQPNKKAAVVHNYPKDYSTAKKITKAMKTQKIPIYLYSWNKKALAPLSTKWPISSNK